MSSSARGERAAERDKRQAGQEPPKKKPRTGGTQHTTSGPADPPSMGGTFEDPSQQPRTQSGPAHPPSMGGTFEDSSQQPRTQDTLLSSSGPSHALSTLSFDSTKASCEDYNERTPKRIDLLTRLKSLLKVDRITSTFWACCQLSDMERLELQVEIAEKNPDNVLCYDRWLSTIPSLWTQRLQDISGAVSVATSSYVGSGPKKNSDGEKWVPRSKEKVDLCTERDGEICVLTRTGDPQAAHIFPYSMLNKSANPSNANRGAQTNFWRLLGVFWTAEHVAEWKNKIFPNPDHPDTGIEACFNLISLSASAHWYWNKGRFALKPLEISDDKKKLTVQFFWQPQYSHGNKDPVDLLQEPLSSRDLSFTEKGGIRYSLGREEEDGSFRRIKSGDIFTLTTDDPVSKPLPSWELLDMQWVLQRLTAMSGTVTPDVDVYDNEDTSSGSMLIPDDIDDIVKPSIMPHDNPGDVRYAFDRVTKWIQRTPLPQDKVPDVAKLATDVLASKSRSLPLVGAAEPSSRSASIPKETLSNRA